MYVQNAGNDHELSATGFSVSEPLAVSFGIACGDDLKGEQAVKAGGGTPPLRAAWRVLQGFGLLPSDGKGAGRRGTK